MSRSMYREEDCPAVFSAYGRKTTGLPRQPGCKWFVAQVKSRMDKRFAFELTSRHISHFIPQQKVMASSGGILMPTMKLLMPGFVFVLGTPNDLFGIYDTHRCWNVIQAKDHIGLKEDLHKFSLFVKELVFGKFEKIVPGRRVRFIAGHALAGQTAIVDSRDGDKVALDIRMVGCVTFHCDAKYLEVIR